MWKNRIAALMVFVTAASLLLTLIEVEAAGGKDGGRGGGKSSGGRSAPRAGGTYLGGHTMNRTPTMSRAASRPAVSMARQQGQTRPSISQGRVQQSRQTLQQRPSVPNRAELRNQVKGYAQSKPPQNIDRQAIAKKAQNFSSNRGNQITQNRQLSTKMSQRLHQSQPNSKQWFDRNFFDRHNLGRDYVGTRANLWRPAAWGTLAHWGAWHWSTPYYYDEGYAYPITVESIYPYPNTPSQTGDWLSFGVFAVLSIANAAPPTHRFVQLSLNRSGEIAGVLYNSLTDAAQDLTGMVDPINQKAYWSLANRTNSPIASTGIYNLTEDQTPINVHFADNSDQTWVLVRLQQ